MIGCLISIALLALFNFCYAQYRRTVNPLELRTTKGEFFIHTLHSGNFFSQAGNNFFTFHFILPFSKIMVRTIEFGAMSSTVMRLVVFFLNDMR